MSRKGWPGLGSAFTGFLHRHQTNATFPVEMKKHVVVDIEDWEIARKMYAEQNSNSADATDNNAMFQLLSILEKLVGDIEFDGTVQSEYYKSELNKIRVAQQKHS